MFGRNGRQLFDFPPVGGREEEARRVSSFSIYLSIAVTALFSMIMLVFMRPILELLGAGENTFIYAQQYSFTLFM